MSDRCPTCGSRVQVHTSDEGTSFYMPATLQHDELRAALEELLDVAERIRGGDEKLNPELWYAARDYARVVLKREQGSDTIIDPQDQT